MNADQSPRGTVMLRELDDIISRIDAADDQTRLAAFRNIARSVGPIRKKYMNASKSERKAMLQVLKKFARESWQVQDWPAAVGLSVVALNVESNFVTGPDSAFVKAKTAALILRAGTTSAAAG